MYVVLEYDYTKFNNLLKDEKLVRTYSDNFKLKVISEIEKGK